MFFWTILGIVVIFPRVDSSTEVSRGAFTLTPFPPRRRRKYRRLIESRAAKIARFFFSSSWSSICFACARSRSSFATRAETSACWRSISSRFSGIFRSIDWATEFTSDDLEAEQGDDQHNEAVPKARRDLAVVEHARQDAVPEGVDDRRDVDDRDVRRHRDLALVLRELALLRVVGNHRQDVGDVSARVGGFHDDRDDPLDLRRLDPLREEAQGLRRRAPPADLGRHLLDFWGQLAVASAC